MKNQKTSADYLWVAGLDEAEDLIWDAPRGEARVEHSYRIRSRAIGATGWSGSARGEHIWAERKARFDTVCSVVGHEPKAYTEFCDCCELTLCNRCMAEYEDGVWVRA